MEVDGFGISIFLTVLLVIIVFILGHIIQRTGFSYLHESGMAIMAGAAAGALIYVSHTDDEQKIEFSDQMFFYVVLPPIIFAAGYTMKRRRFFRHFGSIILLGIVGTIVSMIVTALLIHFINISDLIFVRGPSDPAGETIRLDSNAVLSLAALMASTDSVAALALIDEMSQPALHSLLFGEGVINDGLSIVLFRAVDRIATAPSVTASEVAEVFGEFCYLFAISTIIGLVVGLMSAYVVKKMRFKKDPNPPREIILTFMFGYMAFVAAEMLELSGIMSLFFAGVCMGHYTYHNLSTTSQSHTLAAVHALSYISEMFTFMYLGVSVFNYIDEPHWSVGFSFLVLGVVAIARGASVFVLVAIRNALLNVESKISFREQIVLWFSGLIRGAIAFALAVQVDGKYKSVVVTTSLIVVFFSTIVYGALMPTLLRLLKFDTAEPRLSSAGDAPYELIKSESTAIWGTQGRKGIWRMWKRFDNFVMKPLFGGSVYTPITVGGVKALEQSSPMLNDEEKERNLRLRGHTTQTFSHFDVAQTQSRPAVVPAGLISRGPSQAHLLALDGREGSNGNVAAAAYSPPRFLDLAVSQVERKGPSAVQEFAGIEIGTPNIHEPLGLGGNVSRSVPEEDQHLGEHRPSQL